MSDLSKAIEKHLGKKLNGNEITHYSILGIKPESQVDQIRIALKTAAALFNASDLKSSPASAQLMASALKQAQATLMDATQRAAYDLSIRPNSAHVDNWFPHEDPFATFEPALCVAISSGANITPWGSAEDRWSELQRRLPILAERTVVAHPNSDALWISGGAIHKQIVAPKPIPIARRIEQSRRKRKAQQRYMTIGIVAMALVFLSFAGVHFAINQSQVTMQDNPRQVMDSGVTEKQRNTASISNNSQRVSRSKDAIPTQDSGLPSLSKDETNLTDPVTPQFAENGIAQPMNESTGPVLPVTSPEPKMPLPAEIEPRVDSPDRKPEWIAAMKASKQAIEAADFKKFGEVIENARSLCSNDEQRAKCSRLDQLGQLYEISVRAIQSARSKLAAGDVITVGKQKLSFVEATETQLIVRAAGSTVRHPWDKLPPGLALALCDMNLSKDAATDVAARAVYFSLSQSRNELFESKIKEWFEKSVGKGGVREDLPQALTDTYE